MVDSQGVGDDVPALQEKGAQVSDALQPPALNQPVNIPEPPDPPSLNSDRHTFAHSLKSVMGDSRVPSASLVTVYLKSFCGSRQYTSRGSREMHETPDAPAPTGVQTKGGALNRGPHCAPGLLSRGRSGWKAT